MVNEFHHMNLILAVKRIRLRPQRSLEAPLEDPRQSWKALYSLAEILLVVLCATAAGAEHFVEIRRWGTANLTLSAAAFAVCRRDRQPRHADPTP
jgi:hypothetical protein